MQAAFSSIAFPEFFSLLLTRYWEMYWGCNVARHFFILEKLLWVEVDVWQD